MNFNRFDVHYLLLDYTLSFSKSVATDSTFRLQSLNTGSSRFRSQIFSPSSPYAALWKTATFGIPLMLYICFFRQASVSFVALLQFIRGMPNVDTRSAHLGRFVSHLTYHGKRHWNYFSQQYKTKMAASSTPVKCLYFSSDIQACVLCAKNLTKRLHCLAKFKSTKQNYVKIIEQFTGLVLDPSLLCEMYACETCG